MSVPQMPQAATLISTSLMPTSGTGTSSTRTIPFSRYTPARMILGIAVSLTEDRVDVELTAASLLSAPPHCAGRLPPTRERSDPENPPEQRQRRGCVAQSE